MTCVVIVRQPDAVHLFADSAAIGPTGKLVKSGSKIAVFERAGMCAVTRGSIAFTWGLQGMVGPFANYDDARAGIVARLRGLAGWRWRLLGPFELYLAGIDARGQPAAFMLVSHQKHEGIEPMRPIDVPYAVATGQAPDIEPERDPVAFGVRAAELQRAVLQRLPFARASIVGGFLEHATISPAGIATRILGGWNDRLGERLNPAARFTASGAGVRKAARPRGWLATRQQRIMALALGAWAVLTLAVWAIRVAAMWPELARLEGTFPSASEEKFETSDGSWGVWPRPDLGRLLTERPPGRVAWEQLIGAPATVDQHAAATLDWLSRHGRGCRITGSVEAAPATFEHSYVCES